MERADPDPGTREELLNSLAHFASRFVGERDRQDFRGMDTSFDESGNSPCDHACLTRTRSGEYEQRPFEVLDGSTLWYCQIVGRDIPVSIKRHGGQHSIQASRLHHGGHCTKGIAILPVCTPDGDSIIPIRPQP